MKRLARSRATLVLAVVFGAFTRVPSSLADVWQDEFGLVGANATVRAVEVSGGDVYVGGTFDVIGGVAASRVARWDGRTWQRLGDQGVGGTVWTIAAYDDNVYVAGTLGGGNIARWNGSKWSRLGEGLDGPWVSSLEFYNGLLVAGGAFQHAGEKYAVGIAFWDGSEWYPMGATSGVFHDLVRFNGRLCGAGNFVQLGALTVNRVACWDGSAWHALGAGLDGTAHALAVHDGHLYVGGKFTKAGAVSTGKLARWNGTTWESIGYPSEFDVASLAFRGDTLVVAVEDFEADPDDPKILEWDGHSWKAPPLQPEGSVDDLASDGENVIVVGDFVEIGDKVVGRIAEWDGSSWSAMAAPGLSGLQGTASAFGVWQGDLYVAGNFHSAGDSTANLIARWTGDGWEPVGVFERDEKDVVLALLGTPQGLYAGGWFATIGGIRASNIAVWNGIGWKSLGSGVDATVHALAESGGIVYVGGSFLKAGGKSVSRVASWNGQSWSALDDGLNDRVRALVAFDGGVVAGGAFTQTGGGESAPGVAIWKAGSWSPLQADGERAVRALHVFDGELYGAGLFRHGPEEYSPVARWNGFSWEPVGEWTYRYLGVDYALALASAGGELFVGGSFRSVENFTPAHRVARWNGEGWSAMPPGIDEGGDEYVEAMIVHDQRLWIAGDFLNLDDGRASVGVAAWRDCLFGDTELCAPPTTLPTALCGDASGDDRITALDALMVLEASVQSGECDPWRCDINHSGTVTAADALAILRRAIGLDVTLDCPPFA